MMKLATRALVVASFFLQLVSCSTSTSPRWILNWNDIPSLSEFDRLKKPAKPSVAQVKKCLQLRADEFVKDPESLKVRRVRVGDFHVFLNKSDDRRLDVKGYLVTAETDSKNSYGGYNGYRKGEFIIVGSNVLALSEQSYIRIERESSKRWDFFKKQRNELSDKEWDGFAKERDWVKLARKDTYRIPTNKINFDGVEVRSGWNYLIMPKDR